MILAGGVAVVFFHSTPLRAASPLIPSVLLATTLGKLAIVILAAVVLDQARARAYLPLAAAFIAGTIVSFATFLAVPLPGTSEAIVAVANGTGVWLQVGWCFALSAGAAWYVLERQQDASVPAAAARRLVLAWLPLGAVAIVGAIAAVMLHGATLPAVAHGTDTSPYRASGIGYAPLIATVLGLCAAIANLTRGRRDRVDVAVALALLAAVMAATAMLVGSDRNALPWVAMRLFDLAGAVALLTGIVMQLIDRLNDGVRLEAALLHAEARAFEENAAVEASLVKSRFVAAVSHELRTPLGGIIGMAELLERSHLDERQRSCTAAIASSAATLLRIVSDLLDFSRVESGMLELEDVAFDLVELVEDVTILFREQAREQGVALHAFVDPGVPRTISGDPTRVRQVLQNLLNNAVRFTPSGTIRVEVAAERWSGPVPMLAISVRDSGIGISPGAQERIFNAFTQEDSSTARRFGGTGLGLAIARHLVELMGGRITVRSTVGVGSTFTFTIPLRTAGQQHDPAMPLRDVRILVVERDTAIRDLLQQYVAGWEMRAQSADSVDAARAIAARHAAGDATCAIVLVGPSIPPHDATRLVDDLRTTPMLAGGDCIYVRSDDDRDVVCPAGFAACVSSPLRQSTLFDAIARLRLGADGEREARAADGARPRRPRSESILVAEDNEINQQLLVAQLEHLGFTAEVVGDGEAAVAAAAARRYDLIFMDCQMPGVDGFEAARRIRATGAPGSEAPIIAVTANVLPGYRDICVAAGMNDYLAKPALLEPLARLLDRWLPLDGDPPAPQRGTNAASAGNVDVRSRLREIFRGDDERVDATIALAFRSLHEGLHALDAELAARNAAGAARAAHKLKGVAMEVGLVDVAAHARRLEHHVKAEEWDLAASALAGIRDAVAAGRSSEGAPV